MEAYKNPALSIEERAHDLLSKMTLEEKIAQINIIRGTNFHVDSNRTDCCTVEPDDTFMEDRYLEYIGTHGIGYIHDIYSQPFIKNRMQRYLVEETRLGIPAIFTAEALHGLSFHGASIFPVPLTLSQTFNPEIVNAIGDGIASETRVMGHHEILAPNLDVARDPRWGRTEETFGEDTYLSSEMAVAIISGEQKGDISRGDTVIAEPKHYCVYGIPEGGINCAPARVGRREVETVYLPVFEAGITRGGAYNVMSCYNSIDGEIVTESPYYMKEVLKERWGMRGISRADWGGVGRLNYAHHVADSSEECVRRCLAGGLDMQGCCDFDARHWASMVRDLVLAGKLSESDIDDSVLRILKMKFELGLFENPYADENAYNDVLRCDKHAAVNLKAAEEAMVLLTNDGILPLKDGYKKIAVIGPSSASQKVGGYSSVPMGYTIKSVYDELMERYPDAEIRQCDGCAITHTKGQSVMYVDGQPHLTQVLEADIDDMIDDAVAIAKEAELAVLVCGDNTVSSGEGHDRSKLVLAGRQRELILKVAETGTPVVLVLENGKAVDLSEEAPVCKAIVVAGFGGEFGAKAIVKTLAGDINPAGRLTVSYPHHEGMIPCYYSRLPGGSCQYYEGPTDPKYPFGHGLSYTKFEYSDLSIKPLGAYRHEVTFTVKNVGERAGDEVTQLYVNDPVSSIVTPGKLLRKFKRISLEAGESKEISFTLGFDDFKLLGTDWQWKVEPGDFHIMVGASSADIRLKETITIR